MMDITALRAFYRGFHIDTPIGNNAFSFVERANKIIYVAPLIKGTPQDVKEGKEIVFSDVMDEAGPCDNPSLKEVNVTGLKHFVYIQRPGQDIFIVDNHQHVFSIWAAGIDAGAIVRGLKLVHVDQHKDRRQPSVDFPGGSVREACEYAHDVLNVGNFIPPALELGWFREVVHIGDAESFHVEPAMPFVLDIDMDIFAPLMKYIPPELKISRLRSWIARAPFVTIATSPFFMDQSEAIALIKLLLK